MAAGAVQGRDVPQHQGWAVLRWGGAVRPGWRVRLVGFPQASSFLMLLLFFPVPPTAGSGKKPSGLELTWVTRPPEYQMISSELCFDFHGSVVTCTS